MDILIAGGTGFVGSAITRALVKYGHNVILLVRQGSEHKLNTSRNVSIVKTDFEKSDILFPTKPDAVINCIGIIREFPSKKITFQKVHYGIVKYLIDLAHINNINRFIQISALGTGPSAETEYFKSKFMGEELLTASNLQTTIFRPSIIFGQDDEFINMIAGFLKRFSVMPVIGDGRYKLQPVHVEDLCDVVVKSMDDEFTYVKTFEIGGPEILSFDEIVDTVGNALRRKARKLHQPVFMMKIMAALFDRFAWFPVTRDQITMLYKESYTDDSRLFDRYGISPRSLKDSLADYL